MSRAVFELLGTSVSTYITINLILTFFYLFFFKYHNTPLIGLCTLYFKSWSTILILVPHFSSCEVTGVLNPVELLTPSEVM